MSSAAKRAWQTRKKKGFYKRKPPKQTATSNGGVQKGDIFYASWGYDQTNIDLVIVEKVSPSGKTVLCRMMTQKVDHSGKTADYVTPEKAYGSTFRLQVRSADSLVGTYPYCRGGTRRGSFSRWSGRPLYQTALGFGH